jgi:hypothetical protein
MRSPALTRAPGSRFICQWHKIRIKINKQPIIDQSIPVTVNLPVRRRLPCSFTVTPGTSAPFFTPLILDRSIVHYPARNGFRFELESGVIVSIVLPCATGRIANQECLSGMCNLHGTEGGWSFDGHGSRSTSNSSRRRDV